MAHIIDIINHDDELINIDTDDENGASHIVYGEVISLLSDEKVPFIIHFTSVCTPEVHQEIIPYSPFPLAEDGRNFIFQKSKTMVS